MGGSPLGTSFGNNSLNSCKRDSTQLGNLFSFETVVSKCTFLQKSKYKGWCDTIAFFTSLFFAIKLCFFSFLSFFFFSFFSFSFSCSFFSSFSFFSFSFSFLS